MSVGHLRAYYYCICIISDNTVKKMIVHNAPVHTHFHFADSLEGNPRLSPHQQSVLFHHNKRRNHAGRGGYQGRTMSAIRCHYVNPQPMMYPIAPDRFLMRAHLIQVRDTPKNLLTGYYNISHSFYENVCLCMC